MTWAPNDLAAANAAIRLGDVRLPPPGVVIEWLPWSYSGRPLRGLVVELLAPHRVGGSAEALVHATAEVCDYVQGRGTWRVQRERIVCLVHVPPDAPPFEEWLR